MTITDNLNWGQHISEISSKITKTIGFLQHNLELATSHIKEVAYKTLFRPQLEYASLPRHYDWPGGEGAEDSCQVDLQAMEEYKYLRRHAGRI